MALGELLLALKCPDELGRCLSDIHTAAAAGNRFQVNRENRGDWDENS
jgi:hypothetical protein